MIHSLSIIRQSHRSLIPRLILQRHLSTAANNNNDSNTSRATTHTRRPIVMPGQPATATTAGTAIRPRPGPVDLSEIDAFDPKLLKSIDQFTISSIPEPLSTQSITINPRINNNRSKPSIRVREAHKPTVLTGKLTSLATLRLLTLYKLDPSKWNSQNLSLAFELPINIVESILQSIQTAIIYQSNSNNNTDNNNIIQNIAVNSIESVPYQSRSSIRIQGLHLTEHLLNQSIGNNKNK